MDPLMPDEAVVDLLRTMNKGQYLLLIAAIRKLGGELRIKAEDLAISAQLPPERVTVDLDMHEVVIRLV